MHVPHDEVAELCASTLHFASVLREATQVEAPVEHDKPERLTLDMILASSAILVGLAPPHQPVLNVLQHAERHPSLGNPTLVAEFSCRLPGQRKFVRAPRAEAVDDNLEDTIPILGVRCL